MISRILAVIALVFVGFALFSGLTAPVTNIMQQIYVAVQTTGASIVIYIVYRLIVAMGGGGKE